MLTIRVDRPADGIHEGYEAAHYKVFDGPPTTLVMAVPAGPGLADERVTLSSGDRAYVMNAQGDTIATVRGRERDA